MNTKLILIRHGITGMNKQKRYCGSIDAGLSRQGRAQAKRLKGMLKGIAVDKIYCSNKQRALETCRIVFDKSKFTKLKALREINLGVLEGLRHSQAIKRYGRVYENWLKNPYRYHIPGAEKLRDFKKRSCAAINKILRANRRKTVAIVSHGGVIAIFVSSIKKSRNFWRAVPKPGTITVVTLRRWAR